MTGASAELHHIDSVSAIDVQFHDGLTHSLRRAVDMNTEKIVRKSIFLYKFLEGFAGLLLVASLLLWSKEYLGQRHKDYDSDSESYHTHRKEGKE